nr:sorting nexin-14-like [Cherax quadricarinatus]
MKERGQHLDSFINIFLSSTITPIKNKKQELEECSTSGDACEALQTSSSLLNSLFGDNAQSLPMPLHEPPPPPPATMNVVGVFDTVLYLVVRVYGLSINALRWIMCLRVLAKNTLDAAVCWFLRRKLALALAPPRIVKLIHLIRDALFVDPPADRTEADRRARENELRQELMALIPPWLQHLLFTPDLYTEGANTLVSLFQQPVLNKQLSYVLLDAVLDELFPELTINPEMSPFLAS